ncbi:hypothetical protein DMP06_08670 [Slackia equolifaciens]|uniref:Uncharacterized protein n=1 Tax=Slackia equolifaciens TaxID=498718 RepID=A0A3N0AVS7_9ACTN|nr:hypothetical protein [Slackia equolifaciens]RNL38788.1 hypothetical protein DMP06_08670 [Slackia equolifaciens]
MDSPVKKTFGIIIGALFAAYCAIILLITPLRPMSIASIAFALALTGVLLWAIFQKAPVNAHNLFLAFPGLIGASLCFVIQLIAGVAIAFLPQGMLPFVLAGEVILIVVAVIFVLAPTKTMDAISKTEDEARESVSFMRKFLLDLENANNEHRFENPSAKESFRELIELARYSDPATNTLSAPIEADLQNELDSLPNPIDSQTVQKLMQSLEKRNRLCKEGKRQ